MTIRFRTQDTRSSTAKKLNTLLANDTVAANFFSFREVPQTYDQWDAVLEGLRKAMYAAFYPVEPVGKFRTADTRRLRAFKLNRFAEAVTAGPQEFAPVVLGTPAITLDGGATAVEAGASLVVVPALWRANPTATVTYKWQSSADGETWADIAGETSTTYTLLAADAGALIRAVATGTNSEGATAANTNVLGPVVAAPTNLTAPAITGAAVVGEVLSASAGTWSGYPVPTVAYQWKRDDVDIASATSDTYTLVEADEAAMVTVTVTATNSAGNASATSASVGPVEAEAG